MCVVDDDDDDDDDVRTLLDFSRKSNVERDD